MLIWLASYPRSGNTFLRLVLERQFAYHTSSIYRERPTGNTPDIVDLVELTSVERVRRVIDADEHLHFVKNHELAAADPSPAIYLVRDGRDAMVSFAHFLIDFVIGTDAQADPGTHYWQTLHGLITTTEYFGGWTNNVQSWLSRPNTVVVTFEELIRDPVGVTRAALHRLNLEPAALTGDSVASFEQLHRESPRFFRTGRAGNWRTEMDDRLHALFWHEHGATMDRLGFPRGIA